MSKSKPVGCSRTEETLPTYLEIAEDSRSSSKMSSVSDPESSEPQRSTELGVAEVMGSPSPKFVIQAQTPNESCQALKEKQQAAIERVAQMAAQHREHMESRLNRLRVQRFSSAPGASGLLKNGDQSSATVNGKPKATVIFDWDDTLFPTWFIENVVVPCTPSNNEKYQRIEGNSPFYETLREHACVVKHVLEVASRLAHVTIITNARSPWVKTSAAAYLPGLDLEKLLKEFKIRIYYARESMSVAHHRQVQSAAREGVNPFVVAKRCAMCKFLKHRYRNTHSSQWNVVSIGDSMFEQEAVKDLLWCEETTGKMPLCKTVKFMEDPNAKQLMNQLHVVAALLEQVINLDSDLDLNMERPWENFELAGHGVTHPEGHPGADCDVARQIKRFRRRLSLG